MTLARAVACVLSLSCLGCGDAESEPEEERIDISTTRGDPAPLAVSIEYSEVLTVVGGELDGEQKSMPYSLGFYNIDKFVYTTGGSIHLVGEKAWGKNLSTLGIPQESSFLREGVLRIEDPELVRRVEAWGRAGNPDGLPGPRKDGLYEAKVQDGGVFYLLFSDPDEVRMVASSGTRTEVSEWIATTANAYVGRWGCSRDGLKFVLPHEDGVTRHEGELSEDGQQISLSSESAMPKRYWYHEVPIKR